MYKGTIIENSLKETSILAGLDIYKSWEAGDWKLHKVTVSKDEIEKIKSRLDEGPWYIHFWAENGEDIIVVYKDKDFYIKYSDKSTWGDAIKYGLSLGIPEEQLNFLIDQ